MWILSDDDIDVEFMFNVDNLRQNQYKDSFLLIVRNVIHRIVWQNEVRWLPPKMKSDAKPDGCFINDDDILLIHHTMVNI